MTIDELIARESVRELVAGYAHAADRGRFDEMLALFAADATLQIDAREPLVGRDAIRAFLTETKSHLQGATRQALVRHHVSNLRITTSGSDEASAVAYFFVLTERGLDHWGRYQDRFARRDGRWLFLARRVRVDGVAPGSWAAERRAGEA